MRRGVTPVRARGPRTKETSMEFTRVNRTTAPEAVAPATETVPPSRRGRRPFTVRRLAPYGYLSPTALLIIVLMVIPIVMVASYSFKDNAIVEENPVFTGLANYTKVLTDSTFLVALKNTFIFISLSTVAHLILGLVFAMLLNTPLLSGVTKAIFRIVYILPWLFTIAVIAVIWRLLLDPAGVVNYIYKQAFSDYEFSTASASAVIVLLLTMILAFFYVRRLQRER